MATENNKNSGKKKMSAGEKAGIGAGIAAAVAAAALGAYFLYGKDGAKNRRKVKGWMLKAKGEILERMERMEHVSQEGYEQIINKVLAHYRGAKNVTAAELMELAADARKHWRTIKPMLKGGRAKSGGNSQAPRRRAASRRRRALKVSAKQN